MILGKKRTLQRLERMLEDGINGTFSESDYDESELSKLETKWLRYLSISKQSQKNLDREKKNISSLVTDISHQTKTNLANILLYTELLKEQELSPECLSITREIEKYSKKLDFLMQTLIKLSRLEGGILSLEPKENDADVLLRENINSSLHSAEEKKININYAGKKNICMFDRKWTEEAVGNILDNAIKYTPENGRIDINIIRIEMFSCIEIRDNGIGIPEKEQTKIFSRFYRGKNVREQDGIGVGLYLARQIIENEGGYIKVVSRQGKGSAFSIFLPNVLAGSKKITKQ